MEKPWLKFYDSFVPETIEYPQTDLYSFIKKGSAETPFKTALSFMGKKISYEQLFDHIDRFANGLKKLGVKQGDSITLLMPNCPQMVISYYALMRLGAVAVLANPLNVERELVFKIKDSSSKGMIVLDLLSNKVNNVAKEVDPGFIIYTSMKEYLPFPLNYLYPVKVKLDKRMPEVNIIKSLKTFNFSKIVEENQPIKEKIAINPDSLAVLIYSGGTTGISKGIMLSHFALVANILQARSWVEVSKEDSFLAVVPIFHGFGMSICMNVPLSMGGTVILLPKFDAREVVSSIVKYKPTLFAGVPTMFIAIKELSGIANYNLRSLKGIFVGAAPLPIQVMKEFEAMTGAKLIEGYGLTEVVTGISCNPFKGLQKTGTIGIPMPDVEWKIVDLVDSGKSLSPGETGEIAIRCPEFMLGYLNQPEKTAEILHDGWLYSGDIGVMDEDGYITIVDRKKDLVIVGGFNVYPSEIDEILHQHPKVMEAIAVGLPHPQKGEYIKGYVVPKPGQKIVEGEIIDFCKKNLTAYMVPREVELRETLPKSAIGKILRRELREEEEAKWTK